jgi:hypothetical protein
MIIDCNLITSNSTRQHVEIESESRTASMINFVYPQASISSYRLYETSTTKQVVSGDSIDIEVSAVLGGPCLDLCFPVADFGVSFVSRVVRRRLS